MMLAVIKSGNAGLQRQKGGGAELPAIFLSSFSQLAESLGTYAVFLFEGFNSEILTTGGGGLACSQKFNPESYYFSCFLLYWKDCMGLLTGGGGEGGGGLACTRHSPTVIL